jgi:hypothetical protein
MVPCTGESPPTGQVAAKNRSLFSQTLREGSPRNPNTPNIGEDDCLTKASVL